MKRLLILLAALATASLLIAGCTQAAPAAPTSAPKAAEPTKAPAAAAPTKAAEPTKAAAAQPTAAPKVTFPEKGKSITIIEPHNPGNVNDVLTRLVADLMEKEWGTTVTVINKPGGTTQVGLTELARAKPDGYTIAEHVFPTTNFIYLDAERKAVFGRKDLQPVAAVAVEAPGVNVKADSPYKSMKDVVDAAKANPRKIKMGDTGFMTGTHMAAMMLEKGTGASFALAHFEGGPPNAAALLGGHVDVTVAGLGTTIPFLKSNEMRVLGITDTKRNKFVPDVPTLTEQGYRVVVPISRGFVAPAGTPAGVIDAYAAVLKKITSNPDFVKRAEDAGVQIEYVAPAEYVKQWDEFDAMSKMMIDEVKKEEAQKK